jgi:DNA mismatch repair protein MutL
MIGRFPICTLHLQIAYEAVDVNVHPNKLEVRFRDEITVAEAVTTLVLEALQDRDAFERPVTMDLDGRSTVMREESAFPATKANAPAIREGIRQPQAVVTVSRTLPPSASIPERKIPVPVFREVSKPEKNDQVTSLPVRQFTMDAAPVVSPVTPAVPTPEEKAEQVNTILPEINRPLKILGALFNTYILIEYENTLLLVDQHAVHERLLFDRLMREHQGQNLGQELLVPYVISLTKKEIALIEENKKELESVGLTVESFGEKDAAVRTIPMVLGEAETAGFVRDILSDLESGRGLTFEKKRADLLQTACKHAVKGGEALSEDQLRGLVNEMIEKKVTPTCPHGRPLVVAISRRDLDKKFKRIQG